MWRDSPKRKNGKESPERQYNKTDDQPKLLFRQPPEAAEWYGSQREQLVWTVRDLTAKEAGLPDNICCHTFRATGITTYLENGGSVEHAQQIAAHESPRTTKLYDRRNDQISLDEIERILI